MHAREQVLDLVVVEGDAQQATGPIGPQGHRRARRQMFDGLCHIDRTGLTAADIEHQLSGPLNGDRAQVEVHAAFETVGGVGREAVLARAAGNGIGCEEGRFEEHVARIEADTALLSPHDAGHAEHVGVVGNEQGVGIEIDGLFVEQQQFFARRRQACMHRALQAGVVIGVQGLAEFEHHVVGDIHQRADRADATALDAPLHPRRRLSTRIDPLDHPAAETRTGGRRVECNLATRVDGGLNWCDLRLTQRRVGKGGDFTRDTDQAQAVRPVGRQTDFDERIVEFKQRTHILPDRRIVRQRIQATVLFRQAQLARRAQHAERGHTTQLGLLDLETRQFGPDQCARHFHAGFRIRRAAHDLQRLTLPDIDLTDLETIRIRMFFGGDNMPDDD